MCPVSDALGGSVPVLGDGAAGTTARRDEHVKGVYDPFTKW
ncbi:hypothetical protein [Halogeometricum luteum]|nr:hypothetical protein [Halogeometricum sp. S3BR5-2]